jgi:hypothetical protein
VHLDLEPYARHPERLAHAVGVVDGERLRQHVQDLAILRDVDRARGIDGAVDVGLADLALLAGDPTTPRLLTPRMWPPAIPAYTARDLDARHLLGLGDRRADSLDRRVDVDDDPAAQPARGRGARRRDVRAPPRRAARR